MKIAEKHYIYIDLATYKIMKIAENENKIELITHSTIMAIEFIGRKLEKEVLKEAIDSSEAEMVAVIGRRRIGKTFLISKRCL